MLTTLNKNLIWYHRPLNGAMSKSDFIRLRFGLMVEFRFWLGGARPNVYWSRRYKAVAIRLRKGTVNHELVKANISYYIFGFFEALDL